MRLQKPNNTPRYRASLARLMPRGLAWTRHKGSVQGAWLDALACEFNEFETYTYRVIEQWWPHQTCTRVTEWAAATGLPDKCFPASDEIALRKQMLSRLQGVSELPIEDGSAASPAYIKAMCASIGYNVDVWYNIPFRVGQNHCGQRLGALDGQLYIMLNSTDDNNDMVCEPMHVGEMVGHRLVECYQGSDELLCFLKRIVPARFAINIVFSS